MTWEPKNKLDDEDVDVSDDDDKDNSFCRDEKSGKQTPSVTLLLNTSVSSSKEQFCLILSLKLVPTEYDSVQTRYQSSAVITD